MALSLRIEGRFGFSEVQLVKSEESSLGRGSYGAVYRANCDQLVCAAKILHPFLAGSRTVERFHREIEFLSDLRHPNVIQYLGSCADPETGLPVLFMELMDESLTSFLERPVNPPPLPLHVQVNIGHDVAQALSYLHRHEVLHRDLSGNNVLLIGTRRAKVTDFGMTKLLASEPHLTKAPGTTVYMSPEALADSPAYNTKLDVFSYGVLLVQILTRKFPEPGPRMHSVKMDDPMIESGEVLAVTSELERRRNHVELVSPSHPLLQVAISCLKDKEDQRPTAKQLCSQLIALKEGSVSQEGTNHNPPPDGGNSGSLVQELEELQLQKADLVRQNREKEVLLQERDGTLEQVVGRLQEAEAEIESMHEENAALQQNVEALQAEKTELVKTHNQQVGSLKLEWRDGPQAPETTTGHSVAVSKGKVYFCDSSTSQAKILKFDSTSERWTILPECPDRRNFSIEIVDGHLTAIGGRASKKATKTLLSLLHDESGASLSEWIEQFPKMKCYHFNPAVVSTAASLIVAGGGGPNEVNGPVEVMNISNLQWSRLRGLPFILTGATAAIYDGSVYIGGGYKDCSLASKSVVVCRLDRLLQSHPESVAFSLAKKVFSSENRQSIWKAAANLPLGRSSLVAYQDQLLAVGGGKTDTNSDATSEVREYDPRTKTWNPVGRMRVRRSGCFVAVLPNNRLMVCGGDTPDGPTDSVEIASIH